MIWVGVGSIVVGLLGVALAVRYFLACDYRDGHNTRDCDCVYWWGDRSGSAAGVSRERCLICNPPPNVTPLR